MVYLNVPLAKVVFAGKRKMISMKKTILKSLINKTTVMSQMEDYLKAVTDPKGMSGETYPEGTPKTNAEAYLDKYDEERARSRDWH